MNKPDIKIDGLSPEQVKMLDIMWSKETIEELNEWAMQLEPNDFRMAVTLQEMIKLALIDNQVDDEEHIEAIEYLQKFANK